MLVKKDFNKGKFLKLTEFLNSYCYEDLWIVT